MSTIRETSKIWAGGSAPAPGVDHHHNHQIGVGDVAMPPCVDVGLFWDYESVRIPNKVRASTAAAKIRQSVLGHGQIVERKLYCDRKHGGAAVDSDLVGFTVVDCPVSKAGHPTQSQKLIVDIMSFAWQHVFRRSPCCVVLITADGDYGYTVAKIRDLGVKTVVVYGDQLRSGVLLDVCDTAVSWIHDVLRGHDDDDLDLPKTLADLPRSSTEEEDNGSPEQKEEEVLSSSSSSSSPLEAADDAAIDQPAPKQMFYNHPNHKKDLPAPSKKKGKRREEEEEVDLGSWAPDVALCAVLHRQGAAWMCMATAAQQFYKSRAGSGSELLRLARDTAHSGGLIRVGRRELHKLDDDGSKVIVQVESTEWDTSSMSKRLSGDFYLALTDSGQSLVTLLLAGGYQAAGSSDGRYMSKEDPAADLTDLQKKKDKKKKKNDAYKEKKKTSTISKKSWQENWKTSICFTFQNTGKCKAGDKCRYAHGDHDLRQTPNDEAA